MHREYEELLIESAAWFIFAALLLLLVANRFDVKWPWSRNRREVP